MLLDYGRRERNCLDGDSDEWTPNVAALQKLVENAIDGFCRQGHRCASSQGGVVESQHCPGCINKRSTGETIVHCEVAPENAIYPRTLPAAPPFTDGAYDAAAGGYVASRPPDSENERSDAQRA